MSKPFQHKLLLDEHLFHRRLYPLLNQRFDVKHIKEDLHQGGMADPALYELAVSQGRIILTSNIKDFRPLLREDAPGIIGIPHTWSASRIDSKLTSLLKRHSPAYFRGRYHPLATTDLEEKAA